MYLGVSLSSGAARGIFQLGALHAAQCKHLLTEVKYWAGTSIGALIALLCAVGWYPIDILTYLCTNDLSEQVVFDVSVQDLFNQYGLINSNSLYEYFRKMIVHKYGGIPTFEELHKNGITFICTAYQLRSKSPCVYFSHRSHPHMSTLEAAMLSANLPLIFQNRKYNDNYFIDGGVFDLNPAKYLCLTIDHDLCIQNQCDVVDEVNDKVETTAYENEFESASQHSEFHYLYALNLEQSYKLYQDQKQHHHMHNHPDYKIFSVSLDLRNTNLNVDVPIDSLMDYIKEILWIPMFAQPPVESDNHIDNIELTTTDSNITLKLNNKMKIQYFCEGLQQGLQYFEKVT